MFLCIQKFYKKGIDKTALKKWVENELAFLDPTCKKKLDFLQNSYEQWFFISILHNLLTHFNQKG